jgi:hypothetical protein
MRLADSGRFARPVSDRPGRSEGKFHASGPYLLGTDGEAFVISLPGTRNPAPEPARRRTPIAWTLELVGAQAGVSHAQVVQDTGEPSGARPRRPAQGAPTASESSARSGWSRHPCAFTPWGAILGGRAALRP